MDDAVLKSLESLGITSRWLVIILGAIAVVYVYKNFLEIRKLHLEIAKIQAAK